ncbi:MAG: phosphoenolpyruvate synthase, partial [Gammaproteobacteria bacterium]
MEDHVIAFDNLGMADVDRVGGKNASLGEMIRHLADAGVRVPHGFATTAFAYRQFLSTDGLDERIRQSLDELAVDDVSALAKTGAAIRQWIKDTPLPTVLQTAVTEAYHRLEAEAGDALSVAVRSSATAEDLPDASFAGQQETLLNVRGLENTLHALKDVFASLYTDRAISYRSHQGFEHHGVALSAGVQHMVRSDLGASGVMFTLDTESGFLDVIFITSSYGLGETVVQGAVNPDEFYVYKPNLMANRPAVLRRNLGSKAIKMVFAETASGASTATVAVATTDCDRYSLSDEEAEALGRHALTIETHYGRPMDIEWGKDGQTGDLYILQARPETVKSQSSGHCVERFRLKESAEILVTGRSIGQRIGAGPVRVVLDVQDMSQVGDGDVLVTDMTDPDWEPVMKRAAAIVTNRGGRTCHAAIIARELGIPAVVGTGDATAKLSDDASVTVSCAEGDTGYIYEGHLDFEVQSISLETMPELPLKLMMNVGNPDRAFDFAAIPHHGIGLARLEFIINRMIGVHPKALLRLGDMPPDVQEAIRKAAVGYDDPVGFYVEKLSEGIATLAAAFAPEPVIVRLSDFKSNEYFNLLGGDRFEPKEENPMIGLRGAARYVSEAFRDCFELECR